MATTLLQLRTAARRRADQEGSTFVSDEELTRYVNESHRALWHHVASFYGDDYVAFDSEVIIPAGQSELLYIDGGFGQVYLSSALHKLLRLSWLYSSKLYPLRRLNNADAITDYGVSKTWGTDADVQYRAGATSIKFFPTPAADVTVVVRYVPRLTDLSGDTTPMNATLERWSEYVIVDAAIKLMEKEESDASALMAERERQLGMLKASAPNLDAFAPPCVVDARANEDDSAWRDWRWSR